MSKRKILITAGGTGGHIFPAIALGKQLSQQKVKAVDLLYVGGNLAANPYFEREAFSYQSISCATFKKKNPWAILKTMGKILWGMAQSYKIFKNFKPEMIVGFGSYYTLPILLAAKMQGIPFILHEANSIPGKVNRLLSKDAAAVGIHFPSTAGLIKGKAYEVGLPLRQGYQKGSCLNKQAKEYFNLEASLLTILIFGGSQGAVKLNHLVVKTLTKQLLNSKEKYQVIHLTGDVSIAQLLHTEYQNAGIKACVRPFEARMDLAWQAADLAIVRAGAGTIAELMEFEVPGILIPYPHAMDNHQEKNADFLVDTVGGAFKCLEKDLHPELLAGVIEKLSDEKRFQMRESIQNYKTKNRPKDFCQLVLDHLL